MTETLKQLAERARLLCYQIEKCGASTELTEASILASELQKDLQELSTKSVESLPIEEELKLEREAHAATRVRLDESIEAQMACDNEPPKQRVGETHLDSGHIPPSHS